MSAIRRGFTAGCTTYRALPTMGAILALTLSLPYAAAIGPDAAQDVVEALQDDPDDFEDEGGAVNESLESEVAANESSESGNSQDVVEVLHVEPGALAGEVVAVNASHVYATYATEMPGRCGEMLWLAVTHDAGVTWQRRVIPTQGDRIMGLSMAVAGPTVFVAFIDDRAHRDVQLKVAVSNSDGQEWNVSTITEAAVPPNEPSNAVISSFVHGPMVRARGPTDVVVVYQRDDRGQPWLEAAVTADSGNQWRIEEAWTESSSGLLRYSGESLRAAAFTPDGTLLVLHDGKANGTKFSVLSARSPEGIWTIGPSPTCPAQTGARLWALAASRTGDIVAGDSRCLHRLASNGTWHTDSTHFTGLMEHWSTLAAAGSDQVIVARWDIVPPRWEGHELQFYREHDPENQPSGRFPYKDHEIDVRLSLSVPSNDIGYALFVTGHSYPRSIHVVRVTTNPTLPPPDGDAMPVAEDSAPCLPGAGDPTPADPLPITDLELPLPVPALELPVLPPTILDSPPLLPRLPSPSITPSPANPWSGAGTKHEAVELRGDVPRRLILPIEASPSTIDPLGIEVHAPPGVLVEVEDAPRRLEAGQAANVTLVLRASQPRHADDFETLVVRFFGSGGREQVQRIQVAFQQIEAPTAGAGAGWTLLVAASLAGAAAVHACLFESSRHAFWRNVGRLAVAVPLFSRVTGPAVLDQPTRNRIVEKIRQEPGCHYRRLRADLLLPQGNLSYHLHRLRQEGLIESRRDGRFLRFYLRDAVPRENRPTFRSLAHEVRDRLLQKPNQSQSAIAKQLGVSRQAVNYHVGRLRKANAA